MPLPHCPHCLLPIGDGSAWPFPPQALRCPHCRLLIGPGRAREEAAEEGDARSRGSAAGVLANAARREQSEAARDPAKVLQALVAVAGATGSAVERLRMLDYQEEAERGAEVPTLSTVLATFGTWKAARAAAAAAPDGSQTPGDGVALQPPAEAA
jgi:hypothetical protein